MTRLIAALALSAIGSVGWPLVAVVFLLVALVALCGVEYVDEAPDGRRRRLRIRRARDRR